jgi:hypothetical protein
MREIKNHTALDQHVIKTLLYYEVFHYPLKAGEVFRFLRTNGVTEKDTCHSLESLAEQGRIYKFGEFYSLQQSESTVVRRLKGNQEAKRCLPIAIRKARFIAQFPFVRAVMASGSLSKDYMDEKSDLDFFIVTAPSRLWISRTLLVLYKRLFLNNSHKHFCVNYFVDADHLEIEEKNLFTATELATVIPLYGPDYYHQLIQKNKSWLMDYFPNYKPRLTREQHQEKNRLKQMTEKFIDMTTGNFFNTLFMRLTLRRWKRLYEEKYSQDDFKIAFKTKEHVSKNHPRHFQKKVMDLYQEQLALFYQKSDQQNV